MNKAAKREIEYCARCILDTNVRGESLPYAEHWAARLALAVREAGLFDLGPRHVKQGLTEKEIMTLQGLRS